MIHIVIDSEHKKEGFVKISGKKVPLETAILLDQLFKDDEYRSLFLAILAQKLDDFEKELNELKEKLENDKNNSSNEG